MNDWPSVTIVIPTHNRVASLLRLINSLAKQDYPKPLISVVIVADGCTDGTVDAIKKLELPYIRVIEQNNRGPSAARNTGAEIALGELLLFLDDDVEATPYCVRAHVEAHRRAPCHPSVIIGYYPALLSHQTGCFRAALMHWWEAMFDRMLEPGRRFTYSDLLSGNFSLQRSVFLAQGGFNENIRCHEDYELGYRLIKAGAAFFFARSALAYHHECSDLRRSVKRKEDEGAADVQLGQLHPALIPTFPLSRPLASFWERLLRALALGAPPLAGACAFVLWSLVKPLDRVKARRLWRRVTETLMFLAYWRGVARNVAGYREIRVRAAAPHRPPVPLLVDIDLRIGVAKAEAHLNATRPTGLHLRYGDRIIGRVPANQLCERLHAGHLRALLVHQFAARYLRAQGYETADPFEEALRTRLPGSFTRWFYSITRRLKSRT